jgi:hypothetical protein
LLLFPIFSSKKPIDSTRRGFGRRWLWLFTSLLLLLLQQQMGKRLIAVRPVSNQQLGLGPVFLPLLSF